jgi:hypothetical protein
VETNDPGNVELVDPCPDNYIIYPRAYSSIIDSSCSCSCFCLRLRQRPRLSTKSIPSNYRTMACILRRTSLALSMAAMAVVAQRNNCTLNCESNTPCTLTTAEDLSRYENQPLTVDGQPFDWHKTLSIGGMHCLCPHGLTGVRCEVPFVTCDGDHPCYNGGACVPGSVGPYGNEQLYCNCDNAFDSQGYHLVGKYCEARAQNFCDDAHAFFCLNGGLCNSVFP